MGRMASLLLLFRPGTAALMAALVAGWPGAARSAEALRTLRAEFQREKDPVRRAKLFPKLGNVLLAEMRKEIQANEYDRVSPLLIEYRDGATAAFAGLEASGRSADKHPGGYRELEMHLRQSLHVVNDIILALPLEDRDALRKPQSDLEQLDQRLVKALFPSPASAAKTPPSSLQMHPL